METIINLLNQKQEFYKSQGLQLHNLQDDYDLLNIQYGELHDQWLSDCTTFGLIRYANLALCESIAELDIYATGISTRLLSTSNAVESLTDDLCAANDIITKLKNDESSMAGLTRKITQQAIEIKALQVYERKNEVAQAEISRLESQIVKLKATAQRPPVKQKKAAPFNNDGPFSKGPVSSKQLRKASENLVKENEFYKGKYKEVADMYNELVIYQQTAPTFAGDIELKGVGNIHMIDLQWHNRDIMQEDGTFLKTKAQHVLCINDYGSVKTLFRIEGDEKIYVSKTPTGKHLRATDGLTEIVQNRFDEYDRNYKDRK